VLEIRDLGIRCCRRVESFDDDAYLCIGLPSYKHLACPTHLARPGLPLMFSVCAAWQQEAYLELRIPPP
jgi:hypothetical protein